MAITAWDDQQASTWQSICDSAVNKMRKGENMTSNSIHKTQQSVEINRNTAHG